MAASSDVEIKDSSHMHSRDRRWPIMFWVLGVILAVAVACIIGSMLIKKPYIDPGFASLVIVVLVVPMFAIGLASGLVSRHRERLRTQAIAGETTVMPLVRVQPARLNDSNLAGEPLEIQWKLQGKAGAITANGTELLWRRPKKQDVHLAWGEIRLIEVGNLSLGRYSVPGYCVYGGDGRFIEWPGQLVSQFLSLKPTEDSPYEEYRQRQALLLSLVVEHTGLPLRTLVLERSATGERELPAARTVRSGNRALEALFYVLVVVMSLLVGVLSLTMPLTRTQAFNVYVALVAVVYGIYLLRLAVRAMHLFFRSSEPPIPVTLPPLSAELQPNMSVSLKLVSNPKKQLGEFLLGVLFLGMLIPVWFSRFDFPRSYYVDQSITNLYGDLRFIVLLSSMLMGAWYIMTAILLPPRHPAGPVADERGLSLGRGKTRQFIPWHDIDLLIIVVVPEKIVSFTATGNGIIVAWPADARWAQSPDGASSDDAGAQFAAIVAQRAGVQPVTRWE